MAIFVVRYVWAFYAKCEDQAARGQSLSVSTGLTKNLYGLEICSAV